MNNSLSSLGKGRARTSGRLHGIAALRRGRPWSPAARHEEIARMLAGATVTEEARAATARLLAKTG